MSTICYRDRVIAADSRITAGDEWVMPYTAPKIGRLRGGRLWGFAGNSFLQEQFVRWLEDQNHPRPDLKDEAKAIVIDLDGTVKVYMYGGEAAMAGPFFAIGSGSVPALAAMHMGAGPERAVEIAAMLDTCTGGKIITESLRSAIDFLPERHPWSTGIA